MIDAVSSAVTFRLWLPEFLWTGVCIVSLTAGIPAFSTDEDLLNKGGTRQTIDEIMAFRNIFEDCCSKMPRVCE
ncbi:hypothetical protein BD309DRAFT_968242 [Dichomitus squalens]|nr:hypothetical protein BD309DRAFT_968242 [Dichomitus squalens]